METVDFALKNTREYQIMKLEVAAHPEALIIFRNPSFDDIEATFRINTPGPSRMGYIWFMPEADALNAVSANSGKDEDTVTARLAFKFYAEYHEMVFGYFLNPMYGSAELLKQAFVKIAEDYERNQTLPIPTRGLGFEL